MSTRSLFAQKVFISLLAVGCAAATVLIPWQVCLFLPGALTILLVERLRPKDKYPWDYFTLISTVYFLAFVIAPPLILLKPDKVTVKYFVAWDALGESHIIMGALLSIFGYLAIFIGYTLARRQKDSSPLDIHIQEKAVVKRKLTLLSLGFFIIGMISLFLYARVYGGFSSLLKESDFIRSDITGDSKLVFLRNFMPFLVIAAWFPFSILPSGQNRYQKIIAFCIGVLLLGIASFAQFVTAGRADLLFLALPIFLAPYYLKRRWPPMLGTAVLFLLTASWIFFGDAIFAYISYGVAVDSQMFSQTGPLSFIYDFVSEFAHAFLSLLAALKFAPSVLEFRFFTDFYLGVMSLIPERIFSVTVAETISVWNTEFLTGRFQSTVPPGLVASSFYAFAGPGVLFILFGYGYIVGKVERFILRLQMLHPIFAFYYVGIGLSTAYYIILGDPVVYLRGWFYLYTSVFVTIVTLGIRANAWRPLWSGHRPKTPSQQ